MFRQTKAGASTPASNQKFIATGGRNKNSDHFNFNGFNRFGQSICRHCGSDYMKFSINGFCLDCQQRAEYVIREHPRVVNAARNQTEAMTR